MCSEMSQAVCPLMAQGLNTCALLMGVKSLPHLLPPPSQLSVWVCIVWACAQVKWPEPVVDGLQGLFERSFPSPLTSDPLTFTLITALIQPTHLISVRSTHAWSPAPIWIRHCMHVRLRHVCSPPLTTLNSGWKHSSWDRLPGCHRRPLLELLWRDDLQIVLSSSTDFFFLFFSWLFSLSLLGGASQTVALK